MFIQLARLFVTAAEDGEDGLNVRPRPDVRTLPEGGDGGLNVRPRPDVRTSRTSLEESEVRKVRPRPDSRLFGRYALGIPPVSTARLELNEWVAESLPRRPRRVLAHERR